METTTIIQHATQIERLKELIIRQQIRINQLHRIEKEKNWTFYSSSEKEEWYKKFFHQLEIKELSLERLKTRFSNTLQKLN